MQFSTLPPAIPLIREGKLRALATTGAKRVSSLADVPTLAEAGLDGYEVSLWMGIAAPADTPKGIVTRLNREITRFITSDAMKARLAAQGARAIGSSRAEFTTFMRAEQEKWSKVLNEIKIKPE